MSFKRNVLVNFISSIWGALLTLLVVPFYIFFLGVEAYGLIGFFATLQIVFSLLEMGLGAANQREFARHTGNELGDTGLVNLARALAVIYWGTAGVIGVSIAVLAPWLSKHWLNITQLSLQDVQLAIILMGVSFAIRWPSLFYGGGLLGMQKQVPLSSIKLITDTLRAVGSVLLMWLVSPSIVSFFAWQILVELFNTLALRQALRKHFPEYTLGRGVQFGELRHIWRFAAGMSGISVLVVILMQLDKVILSKLLSLESFGYYTIASSLSLGLTLLIRPIFSATYPKLTQLVEMGDDREIKRLYHQSCQLMTVLIVPITLVIALFSKEVLYLWTNNMQVAQQAHWILSILIVGTALNGLMNIPYALQLAHGWTSLTLHMNLVAVVVLAPLIVWMATRYGAVGAALVWVLLNSGYVFIGIHLMHRRLLPAEKWTWYGRDIALPLFGVLLVVYPVKLLLTTDLSRLGSAFVLGATLLLAYCAAAMLVPSMREYLVMRAKHGF